MLLPPDCFWAKLEHRGDEIVGWHSVADHSADVAACCEALLARTLLRRRLARLAGVDDVSPAQVARLCVLAALHDIGKFSVGFQNKRFPHPTFTCGHVAEAVGLLFPARPYRYSEEAWRVLPGEEMAAWGDEEGMCQLLVATLGHHGRPVGSPARMEGRWWAPTSTLDPFAGLADLVARARRWFPLAWSSDEPPLPTGPAFQHAWAGLVTLADWLGSDADRFFPLSHGEDGDRMVFARRRAEEALAQIGLDPAGARGALGPEALGYDRIADGFSPRPAQACMLEVPAAAEGSVVVLEAETGSGKTEAAILHFLRLFQAGQVEGMYFALPTRAAATQLYRRVCEAVAHGFPEAGSRPLVVLAVPGYLSVDGVEGESLAPFRVLWNDDDHERFRYRGWAAERPKRYLAATIAVGTIDQVLLSSLQVSHAHLRASSLLRQLLVVDEVHASDAYMTRVLEAVLDHHDAAGGHALLMSATLGAAARARLLARPGRRSGAIPPPAAEAARAAYPAISLRAGSAEPEVLVVEQSVYSKEVRLALHAEIDDPEGIARQALQAARQGARVLVIRNTVSGCQAVQEALETYAAREGAGGLLFHCRGLAAPHHSRYARLDRKLLDSGVEEAYGKARSAGGCAAVATQTVEQSLDLDADLLITDLCPVDVLLQRIGRLHRHDRARPPGFDLATSLVLTPAEPLGDLIGPGGEGRGRHGLGTVYEDLRILEATRRTLAASPVITIPADNRRLVEAGTHPEVLSSIVRELGGPWEAHQNHAVGVYLGMGRHADLNLVRRDLGFDPSAGPLFPSGDTARRIPTRLGEDDRIVRFEEPQESPFGAEVDELRLPGHLVKGLPPRTDALIADQVETTASGFRFRVERWSFTYDRLGLRSLEPAP